MFKTRRIKKDIITSDQDGWQTDIVRRLVDNAKQDSLEKTIFYKGYAFTIDGFTQKLYEDHEVQRKGYGNLQMKCPDANVFVGVEFVITSGEDFYYMTKCEEPENPDMLRYRKNFG
ncbi:MAG: hypothetical protein ACLP7A_00455 [Desulfobaccales bacterium]